MKNAPLAVAVACFIACNVACAQPSPQPSPSTPTVISMRQAIAEALARNPNRVRAGHEVTAATFERDAAEWGRFPSLSVDAGAGAATNTYAPTSTIRLEQPLWAGGRIDAQIDSAKAQVSAAEYGEAESRRKIAEDTAVAYIGWRDAAARVEIAREGSAALEQLLNYVKRREQEGLASPADVNIAVARHGAALGLIEELRGLLDQARAQLEALTVQRISGITPVSVQEVAERPVPDVESDYIGTSQLVAQRRAEVEAARAQAAVRRGQMLPTVALRVEHLIYQNQSQFAGPSSDSRALLVLQYTPGSGLGAYSGYQAAGSRIDSAIAQLAADENDARLRARSNASDYRAARRQVAELVPQVEALDTATSSFMRQFEAGRKSWLEVLNTQREVIDSKLSLSRARTLRDQAALRLMVNTGSFWTWLEATPQ